MSSHKQHTMRVATIRAGDRGRSTNSSTTWGKFCKWLSVAQRDEQHTMLQYQALGVDGQNKAKDVGSYVLGQFENNVRKKENIKERYGVALDIDNATNAQIEILKLGVSWVNTLEFCALTSRSHTVLKPKWRLIFPLLKPIPADNYPAVSRILASRLFGDVEASMEATDDVSFRVAQIMYKPSVSKDGVFEFWTNSGALLDADALLAEYPGWEDFTKLPFAPSRGIKRPGQTAPAERPNEKAGPVGAFCRAYSITQAMEKFLPGVYVNPVKEGKNLRYTYSKGHGSKGALVYDDGLFLYSHHGTDPCGERNVNAWDMVRLHRFGDQDKKDDGDLSPGQQPSFKAMRDWTATDPVVAREVQRLSDEAIDAHFEQLEAGDASVDIDRLDLTREIVPDTPIADDFLAELMPKPAAPAVPTGEIEYDVLGNPIDAAQAEADRQEALPNYVKQINKQHALAMISGKAVILYDHGGGSIDFGPVEGMNQKFANKRVPKKGSAEDEPVSAAWMRHEGRRQYLQGITFDPTYTGKQKFNMWTGFDLKPNPKAKCPLILAHMKEVICAGSERDFRYLLGWMAHMMQRPEQKPGVAIVFRGKKGAGKDTLGYYIKEMVGSYYLMLANPEYLYGKHNRQLERCLFVQLEEAVWVGNLKHEPILKSLITGSTQFIEPKGIDGYHVKSIIRLMMSTNADWAVPATTDERRFFVTNVSEHRIGDRDYFDALYREMTGEGPAALMHLLLTMDLSDFSVRDVPDTDALAEQKEHGHKNLTLFWRECLDDGRLPGLDDGLGEGDEVGAWEKGYARVFTGQFQARYQEWMRHRRYDGEILEQRMVGKKLKELVPEIEKLRVRVKNSSERPYMYVFPPLGACREAFSALIGSTIDWSETETSDEIGGELRAEDVI